MSISVNFKIVGKDFFEVFNDEAVTYVKKVQDFSKIDNSFGDFTFSFNIPASPKNLDLLDFYNVPEYLNALNPFTTIEAEMWVNGQKFSSGSLRVVQYAYENLEPTQINIQYLAEGNNLKNALTNTAGDPVKLFQLADNWNGYEHSLTRTTALSYLSGGNVLNSVGANTGLKYPMASQTYAWSYNSAPMDDYRQIALAGDGILNTELRPAIKVSTVVDEIFSYAGFAYDIAFDIEDYYDALWMWVANGKTYESNELSYTVAANYVKAVRLEPLAVNTLTFPNITKDELNLLDTTTGNITIAEAGTYTLKLVLNAGSLTSSVEWRYLINGAPSSWAVPPSSSQFSTSLVGLSVNDTVSVQVRNALQPLGFNIISSIDFDNGNVLPSDLMSLSAFMPDITCTDFLLGLLRSFNAVMYWDESLQMYIIDHRNNWIDSGLEYDISDNVDTSSGTLAPPEFFKSFSLKWKDAKDYLNETFLENSDGRQYGSTSFGLDYKYGDEYEQENTFTNTLWQEVVSFDSSGGIVVGSHSTIPSFQSVNPKEQDPGVRLMYYNGTKSTQPYTVADSTGKDLVGSNTINNFQNVLIADDLMISYNAEYDYDLNTLNIPANNYYTKFYSNYVSLIYAPTTRRYTKSAYLTLPQILDIQVNDTLVINGKRYLINEMRVNFLTGKVDFSLIDKLDFEVI